MSALPALYQDNNRYSTHWFRMPSGKVTSYRWREGEVQQKRALLPHGAIEIEDPFRKGAPLGGYTNNRQVYVAEVSRGN